MTDLAPKTGTCPARGYSWPPFEKGNLAGLRSGAWSPRFVDPIAGELVEMVLEVVPYLRDPPYAPSLWRWAQAEARVQLLTVDCDTHGITDEQGLERPAHRALLAWHTRASNAASKLGLDPASRSSIERNLSSSLAQVDMSQALAEGRRLRLAAEKRMANEEPAWSRPADQDPGIGAAGR